MFKSFDWTCPYCNRAQAVTEEQFSRESGYIRNAESVYQHIGYHVVTIRCANDKCKKLDLKFILCNALIDRHGGYFAGPKTIKLWPLLPESGAKPQPDYIPKPIVEDYVEACRICDLSPKASATLSRRCLQGMIRDFCGIAGDSLFAEIETLRKAVNHGDGIRHVNHDTVEAIDHVRKIGKYGAHMEKDVNLIINVEPHEAQKLIELIELLFYEWYVQRESRSQRLAALKQISDEKEEQRSEIST